MIFPSDGPIMDLLLCGAHEKYLDMGSILVVIQLQDGRHYPVGDPFIEGKRLLQIWTVRCKVTSMRNVFGCKDALISFLSNVVSATAS